MDGTKLVDESNRFCRRNGRVLAIKESASKNDTESSHVSLSFWERIAIGSPAPHVEKALSVVQLDYIVSGNLAVAPAHDFMWRDHHRREDCIGWLREIEILKWRLRRLWFAHINTQIPSRRTTGIFPQRANQKALLIIFRDIEVRIGAQVFVNHESALNRLKSLARQAIRSPSFEGVDARHQYGHYFQSERSLVQAAFEVFEDYAPPAFYIFIELICLGAWILLTGVGFSILQFRPPRDWSNRLRNATLLFGFVTLIVGQVCLLGFFALKDRSLVLAMPAKIGHKLSAFRLSIAHEARASDNTVERVAARKIETIPVTSGVLGSLIVPVENAIGEIQLYGLSFVQLRQAHYRLPYLWKHFDPNIQGKSLGAFDLYAAIYGRGIVNKRVASLFLWNNFHKHPVRKHVIGATFPDIFNGELHIARGKPLFNITSKGL